MSRRYFGTDGIRGRVGESPITPEFVMRLGWAAGRVLSSSGRRGKVVIGKDTRLSGYMFESALESGLSAAGVDIRLLGPMPTPAIAYLTRTLHAQAGIVISASHNPYNDNGIKFFSASGHKLPDEVELAIEAELERPLRCVDSAMLGKAKRIDDAAGRYIEFCKSTIGHDTTLDGLKVVIDCANGATYHVAPPVLHERGAEVIPLAVEPDGLNINEKCGSTHPKGLQVAVLQHGADVGIALDGDGDRVVMVDASGEVVDGDELIYIIARARQAAGQLQGGVVGTLMSNLGLEQALESRDIPFERASVGDRYVMERLQERGWGLGGESSGHILCLDRTTTGDGIVSALQILEAMVRSGRSLKQLKQGVVKYPQHMVNVPLRGRIDLDENREIAAAVAAAENELGEEGRVLLRASGTEPVVRVMVEGRDNSQVERLAATIAEAVSGAPLIEQGAT